MGGPADLVGPVALRPTLASGLPFSFRVCLKVTLFVSLLWVKMKTFHIGKLT